MVKFKEFEFDTIIRNNNYILRDHRVHHVRVMPGVTFISLLYEAFQKEGYLPSDIELRDILFQEAVVTTEQYDRELRITLNKSDDKWKAEIKSRKIKSGRVVEPVWVTNFNCTVVQSIHCESSAFDIEEHKISCSEIQDMDMSYSHARRFDINHYEFMKSLGSVYVGKDFLLAELGLGQLAANYLERFYLHPVYLDASTLIPALLTLNNAEYYNLDLSEQKPSIPMYIESFKVYGRLGHKCFVHVNKSYITSYSNDVMYSNIEIYDEWGNPAVIIKKLAYKRIRSRDLITNLEKINFASFITDTGDECKEQNGCEGNFEQKIELAHVNSLDNKEALKLIEEDLKEIVSGLISKCKDQIIVDEGFYDLGLDSGHLLKVVRSIEAKLGKQLYPTLLFEYTNIKDLALYLKEEFGDVYTVNCPTSEKTTLDTEMAFFESSVVKTNKLPESQHGKSNQCILVISYDRKMDENWKEGLKKCGFKEKSIFLACVGSKYTEKSTTEYEIDPLNEESFELLLRSIAEKTFGTLLVVFNRVSQLENEFNNINKDDMNIDGQLDGIFYPVFNFTKAAVKKLASNGVKLVYVYTRNNTPEQLFSDALAGFARTLRMENRKVSYKLIGMEESDTNGLTMVNMVTRELDTSYGSETEIFYKGEDRYVRTFKYISRQLWGQNEIKILNGGTYLITGGLGGLGMLFAEYLSMNYEAGIILAGRSDISQQKELKLRELEKSGAVVKYVKADISNSNEVQRLIEEIKGSFGKLHGIIHCAGVVRDSFIINKNKEDIEEVIKPKINGVLNLDRAVGDENIDFMLLFSSMSSVMGSPGQADYAYANGFLDSFASYRDELRKKGLKKGYTISINWPLWQNGGMSVDEQTLDAMKNALGLVPLSKHKGINAFNIIMGMGKSQVALMEGEIEKIQEVLDKPASDYDICHITDKVHEQQEKQLVYENTDSFVNSGEIAIIGLSGKYPEASDLDTFWENIKSGRDCIREISSERWDYREYYDSDRNKAGAVYSKWGGFLNNIDQFDSEFFNIPKEEADLMDPQERLFLEIVWKAVEDAGYTRKGLGKYKVGVFVGAMYTQYQIIGVEETAKGNKVAAGSFLSSIANRVSYFMDFKGPSLAVDTACSSSLESIRLACQAIQTGDCHMAVAGGVNISIHPSKYQLLCQANFLSADGKCKSFGEGGEGYVPGEGVGAVILKSLSEALKDGDHIYAVIRGISVNHVGKTNGYSVPNPKAESELVIDVLRKTQIPARSVSYIEAHSTGTFLGDLIEISGLNRAFGEFTQERGFCSIGSVKSNIGHLESAAGIASLTKVILQMKNRQLVPSIHSEKSNPVIKFENTPFYIQKELSEWKKPCIYENGSLITYPRRAGISAFGAGGTNVYLILEEYDDCMLNHTESPGKQSFIFILSSKTPEGLREYALKMARYAASMVPSDTETDENGLIKGLCDLTASIIGVELGEIDCGDSFEDMGFDGLLISGLVQKINEYYNLDLNFSQVSIQLSVKELAGLLKEKYPGRLKYSGNNLGGSNGDAFRRQISERTEEHEDFYILLYRMAYTLQVGREAMEERLAFTASSFEEVREKFISFYNDTNTAGIYRGSLSKGKSGDEILDSAYIKSLEANGNQEEIARLWAQGANIDWMRLYGNSRAEKLPLPTYPFTGQRHWIGKTEGSFKTTSDIADSDEQLLEFFRRIYDGDVDLDSMAELFGGDF